MTKEIFAERVDAFAANQKAQFSIINEIADIYLKISELEHLPAFSPFGTLYQGKALIACSYKLIERLEVELYNLRLEALSL